MTVSKSPRLGLTRWSADTDPWARADFDDDNAALESLAALDVQVANKTLRPAAGIRGRLCWVETEKVLYRDTGTEWRPITQEVDYQTYFVSDAVTFTAAGSAQQRVTLSAGTGFESDVVPNISPLPNRTDFDPPGGVFVKVAGVYTFWVQLPFNNPGGVGTRAVTLEVRNINSGATLWEHRAILSDVTGIRHHIGFTCPLKLASSAIIHVDVLAGNAVELLASTGPGESYGIRRVGTSTAGGDFS